MASRKVGNVIYKHDLSPKLTTFRVTPEDGEAFPTYTAGQYIALGRDDARLTKKVGVDPDGRPLFEPDLDENGQQRIGPVMHSYSVASAPWETGEYGFLEFYVVLELDDGVPGRLSTVLLGMPCCKDQHVHYVDRIVGSFTLDKLVQDAKRVIMIGTGTGLAPFISMVKQLHHDGGELGSHARDRAYTLLHTNRTTGELGYHQTLLDIASSGSFDFHYLPTVSRPTPEDGDNPVLGTGRATNILRVLYDLPMKEEEDVAGAVAGSPGRAVAEAALARTPRPTLPPSADMTVLRRRFDPTGAVILTSGNPASSADIEQTAARVGVRSEVEPW